MDIIHTPVLVNIILNFMPAAADNMKVIDATLGEGGHSEEFLKRGAQLLALDRDEVILEKAKKRLAGYDNVTFALCTYDRMDSVLPDSFGGAADFILFDLGVSLFHFKEAARGFSFQEDTPLDMRLSVDADKSARDVVNGYSEEVLSDMFYRYGQIPYARRIAERIVRTRKERPIETAKELEEIVFLATPKKLRHGKTHPATRAFQALRIEVNDELTILENALETARGILREGGIIVTMSYHSLEDKLCKEFFRTHTTKGGGDMEILTKKPITPSEEEVQQNPPARSAKLRAGRKVENS